MGLLTVWQELFDWLIDWLTQAKSKSEAGENMQSQKVTNVLIDWSFAAFLIFVINT